MAGAATARTPGASRFSIGQVLHMVQDEFPELSHSKLHYLEAEGLISPERTASGYRKYSQRDVDRLLFVLRAQRDRFWPLKVIKDHLRDLDRNGDSVTSIASRPGPSAHLQAVKIDRDGLRRQTRVEETFLTELEHFGLLPAHKQWYSQQDIDIVVAARTLAEEGLQPRHLVLIRSAAEREAHMIDSVAQPRRRSHSSVSRGEAESLTTEMTEAVNALHNALLRRNTSRSH